jgi:hypothetical protein
MYFMDMMDLKKKDLQLYLVCKVVEPFHANLHTDIISGLSPVLAEKSVRQLIMAANAHHHPPEASSADAKPLGTGRVNDVVRRLHKRSRLSIEYSLIPDILRTRLHHSP